MNIRRILIPTDFSELAQAAAAVARALAESHGATLHVLHVVSPAKDVVVVTQGAGGMTMGGMDGSMLIESIQVVVERRTKELAQYVAEIGHELAAEPVAVVRVGVPWNAIVGYAVEVAIDLIVIGSHARGVMRRILLGSTSKAVLEHGVCPVLMVPIATLKRSELAPIVQAAAGSSHVKCADYGERARLTS